MNSNSASSDNLDIKVDSLKIFSKILSEAERTSLHFDLCIETANSSKFISEGECLDSCPDCIF